jgi:hypothetical protein
MSLSKYRLGIHKHDQRATAAAGDELQSFVGKPLSEQRGEKLNPLLVMTPLIALAPPSPAREFCAAKFLTENLNKLGVFLMLYGTSKSDN